MKSQDVCVAANAAVVIAAHQLALRRLHRSTTELVARSIELTISYVYHALHAYADRDNVGLPGFADWFKDQSDEERTHAQLLLNFQVTPLCESLLRTPRNPLIRLIVGQHFGLLSLNTPFVLERMAVALERMAFKLSNFAFRSKNGFFPIYRTSVEAA